MTKADHEVDALGAFDEAIRFDKTNGFAYLQRGKLLLVKNKSSKAADDLERAASLGSAEAKSLLKTLGN